MLIKNFRIYRLQIPFSLPVSHNLADRGQSEALLVIARSGDGIYGYGEGTPRAYVTGEDIDSCIQAASKLCGLMKDLDVSSFPEVTDALDSAWNEPAATLHPSAFCAVELSVLDLCSRLCNRPLWNLFAPVPVKEDFVYSAVIPMLEEHRLNGLLDYVHAQEISFVKVKVSDMEAGRSYTARIRQRLGRDCNIRVDANGAFSGEQALEFLDRAQRENTHISAFEQPVPADDIRAMELVTSRGGVPVFADESFRSEEDMRKLMERKACTGFNIRLSKCGGFRNSLRLYNLAVQNGFSCQFGCHVGETAVLAAAGRHLAALCSDVVFLEGSYSRHVLKEDISVQDVTFGHGGRASMLPGAGIGITLDEKALARWGELVHEVTA